MRDLAPTNSPEADKRHSSRVEQAVPMTVVGVDALGRPFQERTTTLIINCQGCRYQSKHYVLKNMWVTLEVPHPDAGREPRSVRARVAWIQRPRTVRELFQVAVALENPGNFWGIAFPPADWFSFPNGEDTEDTVAKLPSPLVSNLPSAQMPAENWSAAAEAPDPVADNLYTMLPSVSTPISPSVSIELSSAIAQQIAGLVNEAKQELQAAVRESSAEVLSQEARALVAGLQVQLRGAAEQSVAAAVAAAIGTAVDQAVDQAARRVNEVQLDAWREQWNRQLSESIEQTSQEWTARLGDLERGHRTAAGHVERDLGLRVAAIGKAFVEASAEVESALGALRASVENEAMRAQEVLTRARYAAQDAERQAAKLDALVKSAEQEIERRVAGMLEGQTQEAARRSDDVIEACAERLRVAEETLRMHQEDLTKSSELAVQSAFDRMQEAIGAIELSLEESGRTAAAKWVAEIDVKASETTHSTFESLFKTADWYEKKVSMQMQATLEKGIEQATGNLRERAGEISGIFAAELDHYSRSYVEHTQGQLEESERDHLEHLRNQSAELAAASAASIAQQAQDHTEIAVEEFRSKATAALAQASAQMETHAVQFREKLASESQRHSVEFRAALAQEALQAVSSARQDLLSQAGLLKDDMRLEGQTQEKQLREALLHLGHQSIAEYKEKLENASTSWLLTTISKLNRQSEQRIENLARSAEERLRETSNQVFVAVGEALRQRLLELVEPPPITAPSSNKTSE